LSFSREAKVIQSEFVFDDNKLTAENLRDYHSQKIRETVTEYCDMTLNAKDVVFHLNTDANVMKIVSKGIEWVKDREYIIRYEQLGSGCNVSVADA